MMTGNWSTPSAHDGRRPGNDDTSTQGRNLKREAENFLADAEHAIRGGNLMATPKHAGGIDLEGAAELWQTPSTDSFRSRGGDRKDEMGLDQQARFVQFPTPAARDYRSESGGAATMSHFNRPAGPSLPAMIEHSFRQDQPTETHGEASSQQEQTSHPPSAPKRLNPKFVEWLQGLPEGWTSVGKINSEALVTWSAQSRALLRSLFSSIER
jgi:hypothetical protein